MNVQRRTQLQRLYCISQYIADGYSKKRIVDKLYHKFNKWFSFSQIEKDISTLRMDFDAPIKYDKQSNAYYYDEEYDFFEAIKQFVTL